jgi:hypothetical protein
VHVYMWRAWGRAGRIAGNPGTATTDECAAECVSCSAQVSSLRPLCVRACSQQRNRLAPVWLARRAPPSLLFATTSPGSVMMCVCVYMVCVWVWVWVHAWVPVCSLDGAALLQTLASHSVCQHYVLCMPQAPPSAHGPDRPTCCRSVPGSALTGRCARTCSDVFLRALVWRPATARICDGSGDVWSCRMLHWH